MTYDIFTIKAQEAILKAQKIAKGNDQQTVDTSHLLKAMLENDEETIGYLLKKVEINVTALQKKLDELIEKVPAVTGADKQYLSNDSNVVMAKAKKLIKEYGDEFISLETMLHGILAGKDETARWLKDQGATEKKLKMAIQGLRKGSTVSSQGSDNQYNALKRFGINLCERARSGKLDPIIGRDEEIRRILHILSRRKKNNPIIIGEPGVGKTAIVEGIAWRIVNEDVPENLKSKRIYTLDLASLIAGAKYKGEFEERLKGVIKEVASSDGEIILFVDEIHTLIGAGGGSGAMDAANILKPALARGELRTIGATTLDEYSKYFERDKALERRFQRVMVDEPSVEDTVSILRGLRGKYESYHKVRILDEALIAAAELSHRYISDRYLPDKAIDLMDESAAKMRLEMDSVPEEVDQLQRRLTQLEIEREALKRENDEKKIAEHTESIANISEQLNSVRARWEEEKALMTEVSEAKKRIDQYAIEADQAERESNYEKVATLRYGKIKEEETKLEAVRKQISELSPDSRLLSEAVTRDEVAAVVAQSTGIPVAKLMQSEKEKLLKLEDDIHKRLIGQDQAVIAVSDAVRRSRAGLQDPKKPIGSFIFLGPTGVGKTELAKALAVVLFDDENAITRIDMSEYMEKHSVSRLVGAPPGYVGYDEGGQLTEAVRRKPYSIVLLDEIEKAHPDTFNILLQVLDDGRLTDNKGRTADFRNTIIIMTSNMGAHTILENFEDLEDLGEKHRDDIIAATKDEVFEVLKEKLRPEFLNRIDEKIMFLPLTKPEMKKILGLMLKKVHKTLAKSDLKMELSERAMDLMTELGYDPQFGARPMKRVIQRELLNSMSKELLAGSYNAGDTVYIDADGKNLIFSNEGFKGSDAPIPESAKPKKKPKESTEKIAEDLEKAAKDVQDAVDEVKGEDNSNNGVEKEGED